MSDPNTFLFLSHLFFSFFGFLSAMASANEKATRRPTAWERCLGHVWPSKPFFAYLLYFNLGCISVELCGISGTRPDLILSCSFHSISLFLVLATIVVNGYRNLPHEYKLQFNCMYILDALFSPITVLHLRYFT